MTLEALNWGIWSVCGLIWIWNGWRFRVIRNAEHEITVMQAARHLELDQHMRETIAKNSRRHEELRAEVNHHLKRTQ